MALIKRIFDHFWPHGHPSQLIQVTGTNGKGSVCRFLEKGLSLDAPAGSFTNPHLFDFRERFQVNGQIVSSQLLIDIWEEHLLPLSAQLSGEQGKHLTFSEICLFIALFIFEREDVKWGILETGVGGRYERLTTLDIVASIITNIGGDHPKTLGEFFWQKALDKGGICRDNIPLFTAAQDEEVLEFLRAICHHKNSQFFSYKAPEFQAFQSEVLKLQFSQDSALHDELQQWNALLALEVVQYLLPSLNSQAILEAFSQCKHRTYLNQIQKNVYLDIAHNPEKLQALLKEIQKRFREKVKIFMIGLSGNRSPVDMFEPLLNIADYVIMTSSAGFKEFPVEQLALQLTPLLKAKEIPYQIINDPSVAYERALDIKKSEDIVFITGSTYMIEQALNPDPYLKFYNANYGWREKNLDSKS